MTKNVYFVRHGESRANKTGIREGDHTPLTERGVAQANAVARRMSSFGITKIVSSDYQRALHTAEICRQELALDHVEISPLIRERRNPSAMLGSHVHDPHIEAMWDIIAARYGTPGWRFADEENHDDLVLRADDTLRMLEGLPEDSIMAASHGLFMKVLLARVQLGEHLTGRIFWDRFIPMKNVQNTGIMHLQFTDNYRRTGKFWKLISWNDHAHLAGDAAHDSRYMA